MYYNKTKSINTFKATLLGCTLASFALLNFFSASVAQANDISAKAVIDLVNLARSAANVDVLVENQKLNSAAQNKAQDMIDNDYFAHNSPQGKTPWDFINQEGYDYRFAGENLAINFTSAQEEQKAWMESALHRKNILNPEYDEIGVGVGQGFINGHKSIVTVQEFGTQMAVAMQQATTNNNMSSNTTAVAGAAVKNPATSTLTVSSLSQTVSKEIKLGEILRNNKLTLYGWLAVFIFSIFAAIIDVAALVHKKHKQLFILHSMRNKLNKLT